MKNLKRKYLYLKIKILYLLIKKNLIVIFKMKMMKTQYFKVYKMIKTLLSKTNLKVV